MRTKRKIEDMWEEINQKFKSTISSFIIKLFYTQKKKNRQLWDEKSGKWGRDRERKVRKMDE